MRAAAQGVVRAICGRPSSQEDSAAGRVIARLSTEVRRGVTRRAKARGGGAGWAGRPCAVRGAFHAVVGFRVDPVRREAQAPMQAFRRRVSL